jgi:transposase InsO family protein
VGERLLGDVLIGRLGDELLKREVFSSLLQAKVLVEEYRNHYNGERPHSALGYRTPTEVAASCELERVEKTLRRS